MAIYEIVIGYDIYPANLVDNGAKIDWSKGDNGLIFEKKLDGNFIMYRPSNEAVYDAIKAMTICQEAFLRVVDPLLPSGSFVAFGIFGIRDIEYKDDKCQMTIKPRYYDPNGIDAIMDKDLNIINSKFTAHTITYNENYQFEFSQECFDDNRVLGNYIGWWVSDDLYAPIPQTMAECTLYNPTTWSFFSQTCVATGILDPPGWTIYDITTIYFREIKFIPLAIDINHDSASTIPKGTSQYDWEYIEAVELENGIYYNKYGRKVDNLVGVSDFQGEYWPQSISWHLTDYYGKNEIRTLTRARRLIDILDYFRVQFNCTELKSEFFKNNVNPISWKDLTNLMIEQKSDAKFVTGAERTDPARLGIITFRQLMEQLWAMFQVTWTIVDHKLYIEHISFFKWNFNYVPNTTVGLDLTAYYPICLTGSHSYTWESRLPIREKFSFMEAWNIDFVGTDIEYTNCLTEGDAETYSASLITTDLDPTYLDNDASDDGFVIFHCNADNEVISEEGDISGLTSANAHLSWANLHNYYWRAYRPLQEGYMNGRHTVFSAPHRKLIKQVPLEFPFCPQNFDAMLYNLVHTTMGDGDIEKAEYSFKTGNIKIELSYGST